MTSYWGYQAAPILAIILITGMSLGALIIAKYYIKKI